MSTSNPKQNPAQTLQALARQQYHLNENLVFVAKQLKETNWHLERISRRLWAQNVIAWMQIIFFGLGILFYALIIIGLLGAPSIFRLLGS